MKLLGFKVINEAEYFNMQVTIKALTEKVQLLKFELGRQVSDELAARDDAALEGFDIAMQALYAAREEFIKATEDSIEYE
jgi:hypothetical protein